MKKFTNKLSREKLLEPIILALVATPFVLFISIVILPILSGIDAMVTNLQIAGLWWVLPLVFYIPTLAYFIVKPKVDAYFERKKMVYALLFYWEEELRTQQKPNLTNKERESAKELLLERIKVWAYLNPEQWKKYFPEEKYSKHFFGIVDNLMSIL